MLNKYKDNITKMSKILAFRAIVGYDKRIYEENIFFVENVYKMCKNVILEVIY